MRRVAAAAVLAAAGAVAASCNDLAGPGRVGDVRFQLARPTELAQLGGGPVVIDQVRATLFRGEDVALDTTFAFPAGADTLPARLVVDIGPGSEFLLRLQLLSGGVVAFEGSAPVTARREGTSGGTSSAVVQVSPLGPTAELATIALAPRDTTLTQLDTLAFRVSGARADQSAVSGFFYAVRTEDVAAPIAPNGLFVGPLVRRQVRVIARAPTVPPLEDTTFVTIVAEPTSIVATAGGGQVGLPGVTLPAPLTARVLGADGLGIDGVGVTFAQLSPAGLRSEPVTGPAMDAVPVTGSAVTDANGDASTLVVLGTTAGPDNVQAFVDGVDTVSFALTVAAGAPASAGIVAGNLQTAVVGTAVAVPPRVRVLDAFGNAVPNASVAFAVTAGGGSIVPTTPVTTNASGEAALTSWTLGSSVGANAVTATVGTLPPVVFTATAVAAAPASISFVAGTGQGATVGTAVATAPRVRVLDASSNPVPGIPVTFAATNGATIAPSAPVPTDANGEAALTTWTLGTTAGVNTLTADVGGGLTASLTANGTPDVPASFVIVGGNGQTAPVGTVVPTPPSARVQDQYGNGVPGIAVTFTVTQGGGSIAPTTPVATDALGIAALTSWTLGSAPGLNQVSATIAALPNVTLVFDATAQAAGAASIEIVAGDGQQAVVGTDVPVPPVVRVLDALGNPVPAITVTFTPSAGSTVSPAARVSDASGLVPVDRWTLGSTAGAYSLVAAVAGVGSVTFTATAVLAGAGSLTATPASQYLVTGDTARPIVVTARDGLGAPVPGATISWVGEGFDAGGTTTFTGVAQTAADGTVTIAGWRPGPERGFRFLQILSTGALAATTFAQAIVTLPAANLSPLPDTTSRYAVIEGGTLPVTLGVRSTEYSTGAGFPVPRVPLTMVLERPTAQGGLERVVRFLATDDTGYAALPLADCCTRPGVATVTVTADGVPPVIWRIDIADDPLVPLREAATPPAVPARPRTRED